jgi:hypothetical protein
MDMWQTFAGGHKCARLARHTRSERWHKQFNMPLPCLTTVILFASHSLPPLCFTMYLLALPPKLHFQLHAPKNPKKNHLLAYYNFPLPPTTKKHLLDKQKKGLAGNRTRDHSQHRLRVFKSLLNNSLSEYHTARPRDLIRFVIGWWRSAPLLYFIAHATW